MWEELPCGSRSTLHDVASHPFVFLQDTTHNHLIASCVCAPSLLGGVSGKWCVSNERACSSPSDASGNCELHPGLLDSKGGCQRGSCTKESARLPQFVWVHHLYTQRFRNLDSRHRQIDEVSPTLLSIGVYHLTHVVHVVILCATSGTSPRSLVARCHFSLPLAKHRRLGISPVLMSVAV